MKETKKEIKIRDNKTYISLHEASEIFGYTPGYFGILCRQGKLKGKKIGRNWVTKKEWVKSFIKDNVTNGKGGGLNFYGQGFSGNKMVAVKKILSGAAGEGKILFIKNSRPAKNIILEFLSRFNIIGNEIIKDEKTNEENSGDNFFSPLESQILSFFASVVFLLVVCASPYLKVNLWDDNNRSMTLGVETAVNFDQLGQGGPVGQSAFSQDEGDDKKITKEDIFDALKIGQNKNGNLTGDLEIRLNKKLRIKDGTVDSKKIKNYSITGTDISHGAQLKIQTIEITDGATIEGNLIVGGTQTYSGTATFQNGLVVTNGNILFSTTGAIAQSGNGQVTFSGNVDAQNGIDVTGGNLTVGGNNFSVDVTNGNIITLGNLSAPTGSIATLSATTINSVATATITTANITTVDFGTNTIIDGNMNGNWNLNGMFTANGQVALGDGGDDIAIDSNDWDISSAGVASGLTGLASTGTIAFSGAGTFSIDSSAFDVSITGELSGITTLSMNNQLTSTVVTGTAPFVVASTTLVSNLNAQYLNGHADTYFATSSTSVTSISIASSNGFSGTSSGGTAPQLTLSTSVNGMAKGNGTALSAATAGTDYIAGGVGAASQVAYFSGSGVLAGSNNLWFDGTNVGVGTTNPGQKLDIVGGSIRTDNQFITTASTGTAPMVVSSTTLVTNLNADLLDGQQGSYYAPLGNISGTQNYITKFTGVNSIGNSLIYDNGTNVGIGTTNPANGKLEVSGTVYASDFSDDGVAVSGDTAQAYLSSGLSTGLIKITTGTGALSVITDSSTSWDAGYTYRIIGVGGTTPLTLTLTNNIISGSIADAVADGLTKGVAAFTTNDFDSSSGLISLDYANGQAASHSAKGFLTAADWDTFSGKQDALTNPVTGIGTAGYLTRWATSSTVGNSVIYDNGTNVGIGLTNPSFPLQVKASNPMIELDDSTGSGYTFFRTFNNAGAGGFGLENSTGGALIPGTAAYSLVLTHTGNYPLHLGTNSLVRMTIKNDGNVGIGTTSPLVRFDVRGSAVSGDIAYFLGSGSTHGADIGYTSTGTAHTYYSTSDSSTALSLGINGDSNALFIKTDGNVGIGTTSPGAKLEVYSNATGPGIKVSYVPDGQKALHIQTASTDGSLYVENTWANYAGTLAKIVSARTDSNAFTLLSLDNASGNKVTVLGNGNVGIGTTGPGALLDVAKSGTGPTVVAQFYTPLLANDTYDYISVGKANSANNAATFGFLKTTTVGNEFAFIGVAGDDTAGAGVGLIVKKGGNVGIGTTEPGAKLEVWSNDDSVPMFMLNQTENVGRKYSIDSMDDGLLHIYDRTSLKNLLQINGSSGDIVLNPTNGNVGIGTTVPNYKLEVNGDIGFTSTSNRNIVSGGNLDLKTGTNGTLGFGYGSGSTLTYFYSGGAAPKVTIDTNGNVGIGTTGPTALLHVAAAASRIKIDSTGGTGTAADLWFANTARTWQIGQNVNLSGDSFEIYDRTAAQDRFVINSSGNVGIGTTSPIKLLTLSASDPQIDLIGTGAAGGNGAVNFVGSDLSTVKWQIGVNKVVGTGLEINAGDSTANKVYITTGGSVGIGQVVPGSALSVNGGISAGTYSATAAPSGGMIISGNVGIGTTGPTHKLEVIGGDIFLQDGYAIRIGSNDDDAVLSRVNATNAVTLGGGSTEILNLRTSGTDRLMLDNSGNLSVNSGQWYVQQSSGNVGIGTTGPGYKLDVNGSFTASSYWVMPDTAYFKGNAAQGYRFNNAADNLNLFILKDTGRAEFYAGAATPQVVIEQTTGNVGIGTTNPLQKLHIYNGAAPMIGVNTVSSNTVFSVYDQASYNAALSITGAGLVTWQNGAKITLNGDGITVSNTGTGVPFMVAANGTTDDDPAKTIFHVTGNSWNEPFFLVKGSGNVGIGTTAPAFSLDVQAADGRIYLTSTTGTNAVQTRYINTGGNLYIGRERSTGGYFGTGFAAYAGVIDAGGTYPLQFGVNDVAAVTILNGGNVGIGTTSPGAALHVGSASAVIRVGAGSSVVEIQGSGGDNRLLSYNRDTPGYLAMNYDALTHTFKSSGTAKVTILNDGNVGIGTTNPSVTLDVQAAQAQINITSTTGTNRAGILFNNTGAGAVMLGVDSSVGGTILGGSTAYAAVLGTTGALPLQFGTNNVVNMTILSGGNVGIGTVSPLALLHINGNNDGAITNNLVLSNEGTSANSRTAIYMGYSGATIGLYGARILQTGTPSSLRSGDLSFQIHNTTASNDDSAWDTAMFIQRTSGNVGIGTTTPEFKLHIGAQQSGVEFGLGFAGLQSAFIANKGSSAIYTTQDNGAAYPFLENGNLIIQPRSTVARDIVFATGATAPSSRMVIDRNGNVGIGTTSPGARLDVQSSGATTGYTFITRDSNGNAGFKVQDGGVVWIPYGPLNMSYSTNYIRGYDGSSYKSLYVDGSVLALNSQSNGNVGIGTTSPEIKLHVYSSGDDQQLIRAEANSVAIIALKRTGQTEANGRLDFLGSDDVKDWSLAAGQNVGSTLSMMRGTNDVLILDSTGNVGIGGTSAYSSPVLYVKANGNVGIGTTSPLGLLDVYNSAGNNFSYFRGAGYATNYIWAEYDDGTTGQATLDLGYKKAAGENPERSWYMGLDSSENLTFGTRQNAWGAIGDGDLVTITTAGNVGIGTTGPVSRLEVKASGQATYPFRVLADDGSTLFRIYETGTPGHAHMYLDDSSGSQKVLLTTDGTSSYINSGNVGIGTTSPDTKLSVAQAADSNGLKVFGYDDVAANWGKLYVDSGGNFNVDALSNGVLRYNGSSEAVWTEDVFKLYDETKLVFGTSNDFSIGYSDGEDYLQFVDGSALGTNVRMVIDNNGNVGIGTTSPTGLLHIYGTNPAIRLEDSVSSYSYWYIDGNGGDLSFTEEGNASPKVIIKSGGNVGIGTTGPGSNLEVNAGSQTLTKNILTVKGGGTSGAYGFEVQAADGSSIFKTDNLTYNVTMATIAGNVGIGTTGPGSLLDVNGLATIRAGSGTGNMMTLSGLQATNTTGHYITFQGGAAGGTNRGYLGFTKTGSGTAALWTNEVADYMGLYGVGGVHIGTGQATPELTIVSGNVGIGTNDPQALLHLSSSNVQIELQNSGSSRYGYLDVHGSGVVQLQANRDINGVIPDATKATAGIGIAYGDSDSYITFSTGSTNNAGPTEQMRITKSGNVGIGTTTPNEKLQIVGSVQIGSGTHITLSGQTMQISPNSGNASYLMSRPAVSDYVSADWITGADINTGWSQQMQPNDTGLHFYDRAASLTRLYIKTDGNVGIGTTGPGAKLQVAGGDILLDSNNNINIGSFQGSFGYNVAVPGMRLNGYSGIDFYTAVSTSDYTFTNNEYAGNPSKQVMVIKGTGNVGIGTTSPTRKLFVNGDAGGTGAWNNDSYSGWKENFADVSVLDKISALNIKEWQFKSSHLASDTSRHLSPFSEDFRSQFGLGQSDYSIQSLDVAGVALKGVQELNSKFNQISASSADQFNALGDTIHITNSEGTSNLFGNREISLNPNRDMTVNISAGSINFNGNMGIGTTASTEKLTIAGNVNLIGGSYLSDGLNLNSAISEQGTVIKTLSDSTLSINEKITLVGQNLDDLSAETHSNASLQTETQKQLEILRQQMALLEEKNQALIDLALALDPKSVIYKDPVGNLNLEGKITAADIEVLNTIKAKDITATGTVAGASIEMGSDSSGKGTIKAGETEVVIETPNASDSAKISITPKGDTFERILFYEDLVEGESFKVKVKKATTEGDINFDWFIIK